MSASRFLLGRAATLVTAAVLATCGGSPTASTRVDSSCVPDSATATRIVPLFQKPFSGDYRLGNYFDHDLPVPFASNGNGFILTTCGTPTLPGIDGHNGYDWELPHGTPVLAAAGGEVIAAGPDAPSYCPLLSRVTSQISVVLRHHVGGEVFVSEYGHLDRVLVHVGEEVPVGTVVGFSGTTGCSTGPHLHFSAGVENGGPSYIWIDPYGWHAAGPDPWRQDGRGAESVWLWKPGEAPQLR